MTEFAGDHVSDRTWIYSHGRNTRRGSDHFCHPTIHATMVEKLISETSNTEKLSWTWYDDKWMFMDGHVLSRDDGEKMETIKKRQ